jgi:hypothetical protein
MRLVGRYSADRSGNAVHLVKTGQGKRIKIFA